MQDKPQEDQDWPEWPLPDEQNGDENGEELTGPEPQAEWDEEQQPADEAPPESKRDAKRRKPRHP